MRFCLLRVAGLQLMERTGRPCAGVCFLGRTGGWRSAKLHGRFDSPIRPPNDTTLYGEKGKAAANPCGSAALLCEATTIYSKE